MSPTTRRRYKAFASSLLRGYNSSTVYKEIIGPNEARRLAMAADREEWEKVFEEELKALWDGPSSAFGNPAANFANKISLGEARISCTDEALDFMTNYIDVSSKTQEDFGRRVMAAAGVGRFEQRWRGLSETARRDIILNGICMAMDDATMQTWRRYCPESTVEYLTSRGGEAYLECLRQVVPRTSVPGRSLQLLRHPAVEHYLRVLPQHATIPGYKSLAHAFSVYRTSCLVTILEGIFDAFVSGPSFVRMWAFTDDAEESAFNRQRSQTVGGPHRHLTVHT